MSYAFNGKYELFWSADMRYRGQSFEIETSLTKEDFIKKDINSIAKKFHKSHFKAYDHLMKTLKYKLLI